MLPDKLPLILMVCKAAQQALNGGMQGRFCSGLTSAEWALQLTQTLSNPALSLPHQATTSLLSLRSSQTASTQGCSW